MNPPSCSEEGDSQRTGPCRSQGTIGDRQGQHSRSVPPGSAWLLGCWGPRAAARGAQPAPPACPPKGGGVATDSAGIEQSLPQPICGSGSPGHTKPTPGHGEPCQGRDTDPPLCLQRQSQLWGKDEESSTTGACALAAFHLEVVSHVQTAAEVSNTPLLLPAPHLRLGRGPTTGIPCARAWSTHRGHESTLVSTEDKDKRGLIESLNDLGLS